MKVGSDYEDEMDRLDPRSIDAALRGRPTGQPALDRAAQVVGEVRRTLLEEPRPDVAARHLAAMTAAARAQEWGSGPVHRAVNRAGLRRRAAGLAVAAVVAIGGVAAAVTLPDREAEPPPEATDPATERRNGLGGEDPVAPSSHGKEVSETAHDDSLEGCEKGQAVSDVASSNSQGQGERPEDPCVKGDEGGGGGSGKAKPPKGEKGPQAETKDRGPKLKPDSELRGGGPPESGGPPDHAGGGAAKPKGKP
jgi:hypothetical protein